jgi:ferredoxin
MNAPKPATFVPAAAGPVRYIEKSNPQNSNLQLLTYGVYELNGPVQSSPLAHPGEEALLPLRIIIPQAPRKGEGAIIRGSLEYDDTDGVERRMDFSCEFNFEPAPARAASSPADNPYAPGKPLAPDSPMFIGREDVFAFLRETLHGACQENVVALIGPRRIGKTSILRQVETRLADLYWPVFVDVQGILVQDVGLLMHSLAERCRDVMAAGVKAPPPGEFATDLAVLPRFLEQLSRAARSDKRWLIMFDEFDDLEQKVRANLDVRLDKIRAWLETHFDDALWKRVALRCHGCGACAFVCPTCHCFDIVDEPDGIDHGARRRNWDTCQSALFTLHGSGHNPRKDQAARFRQRILHKFGIYPGRFGEVLCTGCGRCVRMCAAAISFAQHQMRLARAANVPLFMWPKQRPLMKRDRFTNNSGTRERRHFSSCRCRGRSGIQSAG